MGRREPVATVWETLERTLPQDGVGGGPQNVPHLLVMLYAQKGQLESFARSVKGPAWDAAFELTTSLPTSDLQGVEPFGFADGLSQPSLDWQQSRSTADQLSLHKSGMSWRISVGLSE